MQFFMLNKCFLNYFLVDVFHSDIGFLFFFILFQLLLTVTAFTLMCTAKLRSVSHHTNSFNKLNAKNNIPTNDETQPIYVLLFKTEKPLRIYKSNTENHLQTKHTGIQHE